MAVADMFKVDKREMKRLLRNLQKLDKKTMKTVARSTVRAAARPIAKDMKKLIGTMPDTDAGFISHAKKTIFVRTRQYSASGVFLAIPGPRTKKEYPTPFRALGQTWYGGRRASRNTQINRVLNLWELGGVLKIGDDVANVPPGGKFRKYVLGHTQPVINDLKKTMVRMLDKETKLFYRGK